MADRVTQGWSMERKRLQGVKVSCKYLDGTAFFYFRDFSGSSNYHFDFRLFTNFHNNQFHEEKTLISGYSRGVQKERGNKSLKKVLSISAVKITPPLCLAATKMSELCTSGVRSLEVSQVSHSTSMAVTVFYSFEFTFPAILAAMVCRVFGDLPP